MQSSCLYLISIGISDEKDMSIKALEIAKSCDLLYAEFYTTKLNTTKENLERLIGKPVKVLSREDVEDRYQEIILNEAKMKKVGLLVGGDVFVATTHNALRLEAIKNKIPTKVIHGSSIISALGETGLHLQKFGPFVTIPFPEKTKGKLPQSVYDIIRANLERNLHTLCLLDVISEEKRYLNVNEALSVLLKLEEENGKDVITKDSKVVVFSAGKASKIFSGAVKKVLKKAFELPSVIIIPAKLHFTEKEYLELYEV